MASKPRKPWTSPQPITRPRSFQSLPTLPIASPDLCKPDALTVRTPKALVPPVLSTLNDLHSLLEAAGLPPLPDPTSQSDLLNCLFATLQRLLKQRETHKELKTRMKQLAGKYQELMGSTAELGLRLAKYKAKSRQNTVEVGGLAQTEVFRNCFERNWRAESETDGRIMALIGRYEDKIYQLEREVEYLKGNSAVSTEETAEKSPQSTDYQELESKLGTNGAKETLEAVEKMQKAINSLPFVEEFVHKVCLAVFPDLETSPFPTQLANMDEIIPTITGWRSRLQSLSQFQHCLAHTLRISASTHHLDSLVLPRQLSALLSDIQAVTKFMQLFGVKRRTEVPDQLEQVFIMVNRAATFLKDAAFALKLDESEAELVYSAVLQAICARQRRS